MVFCVTSSRGLYYIWRGIFSEHYGIWKKLNPLPPNQRWKNGAFWPSCGFILDFGRMGDLLVHFILSKIKIITGGHQFENYHPRADGSKCHHLNMINISLYHVRRVKLNKYRTWTQQKLTGAARNIAPQFRFLWFCSFLLKIIWTLRGQSVTHKLSQFDFSK